MGCAPGVRELAPLFQGTSSTSGHSLLILYGSRILESTDDDVIGPFESAPMPQANTDCNLLFGIFALRMDFINRDGLVAAMNAWSWRSTGRSARSSSNEEPSTPSPKPS